MSKMVTRTIMLLLSILTMKIHGFFLPSSSLRTTAHNRNKVKLFGINEWRDEMMDCAAVYAEGGTKTSSAYDDEYDEDGNLLPAAREMCVLPFPYEDVLLQGETKELRLYEDRFIKLFEECMSKHCGVVAMGLLAESGIIQTAPLCEIEAYNRIEGFGIFVTVRVVGRVSLLELTQQEPYIKAVCRELSDVIPPNLDLPNMVAGNIENFMLLLSSMQFQLNEATSTASSSSSYNTRLYSYEDDDDDDDDVDYHNMDRISLFREAFHIAKATDTQGYTISAQHSPEESERSAQDLTAISWAAFTSFPKQLHEDSKQRATTMIDENVNYRIQALDIDDLFERLKLASFMLREEKAELQAKLALAGLKYKKLDDDSSSSSDSD
uniref:Lon N-terminal domain-containing protein n=2 Tax=Ditylum brightwellii TaxID=49249 RepID=A0A7S4R6W7_9STRA|mmetsp:Transcript_28263/g.37612  ORF Transcript_28263/g.37612 Transcript_28263/m.37612 type:complete len:380 (+) Transcript_28263:160-1299(+)